LSSSPSTTHGFYPVLQEDIKEAVQDYMGNPASGSYQETVARYGDISEWDTSPIVDMSYLFPSISHFNGNINGWDVTNVEDMTGMFIKLVLSMEISVVGM